jgi:peptide subunit release factor 1 (eRF1)
MLDRGVLSRLYVLTQQDSSTLTLYLDIDQNRQSNRNQGFQVQAEALLKDLLAQHSEDRALQAAVAQARELVADLRPSGRTALIVVHPDSRLAACHVLRLRFPASVHWRRGAFLRPVVEAMDDHERYGVVLTDKQRARLFTVVLGELTEHSDLFSDTAGRSRATGSNRWWSDKRHQRHHENEVAAHAKRVIDALHDLALRSPFDRLVVAGPREAVTQLVRLLPRRMHGKLLEAVSLPVTATHEEILERTLEVERRMEREQEDLLVEGLMAELHEGGKAVAALGPVVDAVNSDRVWKLVYAKGYATEGGECRGCGAFSAQSAGACPVCGEQLQAVGGFVDRLSQGVLGVGGQVEVVGSEAASRLAPVGPIAALLRY